MAAQRLFDIAELAENGIVRLPMEQIFIDGRVSKQWRDTIDGSPSVQQKLSLRSAQESPDHGSAWGRKVVIGDTEQHNPGGVSVDVNISTECNGRAGVECELFTPAVHSL
ncbi:hypothetical protein AC579_9145 [Pseudocercospora musae]|uniref:Uncharacterized protein n=1 Tax=Pseudocercospora musae TaxID=113226 RepID=A0A139IIF0_9PEZI|nr:hypothetical protein AC579_9145 [Pseudocercospora musae]